MDERGSAVEPVETHRDDGLDLARDAMRSAAGSTPRATRRRRPGKAGGAGRVEESNARGRSGFSGAHPDERDPQLLDATFSRLVRDRGWALDLRVHGLFARWPEVVGAEIASHCTPESFVDGRLLVRTDSTAWATQLRLLTPQVMRRLAEELGEGAVTTLEVAGPHAPSWSKGRRSVRGARGPRDTYG
ncbi:DciA family protein [Nocardioides sp. TRM66260-LWL]|uniref:DUF721 domain-containing protein n=1 Tax=Nocardioides sp. TRM66260-LWL TaxID=2874478 RepID=UPI001CC4ADBA|nr:DciA family protein [Nocardioides sp. TRM66260-LWL]MBZ5735549.1 DciA family protein [Nocardioides sp. TRM66260-LWL]